jgi:hypothetical protein
VTTPFTCPRCGWTSHNPHDAAERYCGHCHVFVDDDADLVTRGVGFARVGVQNGEFQIRRIGADKDRAR